MRRYCATLDLKCKEYLELCWTQKYAHVKDADVLDGNVEEIIEDWICIFFSDFDICDYYTITDAGELCEAIASVVDCYREDGVLYHLKWDLLDPDYVLFKYWGCYLSWGNIRSFLCKKKKQRMEFIDSVKRVCENVLIPDLNQHMLSFLFDNIRHVH